MMNRYLSLEGAIGAELQTSLTPADAIALLKDGVRRSTTGETSQRNRAALLTDAAGGQYPYAAVLSCIDSRAPVEQIFDAASGDLFVARVAGNVASPDLTASLEYATKYAGSKAILVLGHTRCGAVKGAWAGLEDGHLTGLLGRIQPAVDATKAEVGAADSAENLDRCSQVNVRKTMAALRSESSILAGLEDEGKIAIVGGVYDVATGEVEWLD
ncbi:MAG: carbonic anhydrase [Flavobacteriales bacterium]|nr:carbonic anhydrase [Flavobacteriales bacterium]